MTHKPISEADMAKLRKSTVFLSLSGGKDSTACGLLLREHDIPFRPVFADTGWEHPDTYAYVDGLEKLFGPIARVGREGGMWRAIEDHNSFPSRYRKFCTEELKRIPIAIFQHVESAGGGHVVVVGLRADESARRSRLMPWELVETRVPGRQMDGGKPIRVLSWQFRPLLTWSLADVVAIHQRHGVRPNPLYLRGSKRVGCWPCIHSSKRAIANLADQDPQRVELIAKMEAEMSQRPEPRPRTFFTAAKVADDGNRHEGPFPIRDAVKWSRTARGGANSMLPLDDPNEDGGCGTWGLCESGEEGYPV